MALAYTKGVTQNLKVKFHEVPSSGLDIEFSEKSVELNNALSDLLGATPSYKARLSLRPVDEMVHLSGDLSTNITTSCSRCGEDFVSAISKKFVTAFYKSEDNIKNFGGNIDDIEGSFDLEFLEGNEIDLAELLHEQVAIEIPFQPLCSEDCKGLCVSCGTNLNESTCSCPEKTTAVINKTESSPFLTLKNLIGDN
jgi:uncharacterized protein